MQALPNDKWRDWCRLFVQRGGHKGSGDRLVQLAGFKASRAKSSAKVQAHRLLHDPRMQAAIVEETQRFMAFAAPRAAQRVVDALDDEDTGHALRAANMLFDRVGLHGVTEQRQTVGVDAGSADKLREIALFARMLNLPLAQLPGMGERLAAAGVVIEGEAEEVENGRERDLAAKG